MDPVTRSLTRISRRSALVALAAVGVAACTPAASSPTAAPASQSTTAPSSTSPSATQPAAGQPTSPAATTAAGTTPATSGPAKLNPPQKIKVGIPAIRSDHAYRQMGVKQGFYEELGVEVEFMQLRGDPLVLKALLAQEVDVAEISIVGVLGAIETGGDLKILGAYLPRLDLVLFSKKDINSLQDLYGRSVAHSGDNGLPHAVVLALLDKYGMDPSKVDFITIGDSGERWRSMLTGKFDATATTIDRIPEVEADPSLDIKVLANLPQELPNYVQSCIVTSERTLQQREPVLTNFLVAYGKAMRYCIEHRDETIALSAELASLELDQAAFAYDWYKENRKINPNFVLPPESVQWMQEFNTRIGVQQQVFPIERVLDSGFANKILGYLGEYKV